jgi:hypothetical protein
MNLPDKNKKLGQLGKTKRLGQQGETKRLGQPGEAKRLGQLGEAKRLGQPGKLQKLSKPVRSKWFSQASQSWHLEIGSHPRQLEQTGEAGRSKHRWGLLTLSLMLALAAGYLHNLATPEQPGPVGQPSINQSNTALAADYPSTAAVSPYPELPVAEIPSVPALPLSPTHECPVSLSGLCYQVDFTEQQFAQVWTGYSEKSCSEAAEILLLALRDDGWTLEEHGFVDLFGDAWSCVVSRNDSSQVLIITVMPKHKYDPLGSENPMIIRISYMSSDSFLDQAGD